MKDEHCSEEVEALDFEAWTAIQDSYPVLVGLDCSDWAELAAQLVNLETSLSSRFLGFGPHNPMDVIEEPQAYLAEMAVEQPKVKEEDLLDYRV